VPEADIHNVMLMNTEQVKTDWQKVSNSSMDTICNRNNLAELRLL